MRYVRADIPMAVTDESQSAVGQWYIYSCKKSLVLRLTVLGMLITFSQFLFVTAAAYLTQISPGSISLKQNRVPLRRWAQIAVMFYAINVLNNWAFAFNISVPVHIILRSFGSVTTMAAGMLRGKKYSTLQILSVIILTLGVLVSAWADSEDKVSCLMLKRQALIAVKGKEMSLETGSTSQFTSGLIILLIAQLLSAFMGAFVEDTYRDFKASWTENLFYSHLLSLPLFLPLAGTLRKQYARLASTSPLQVDHFGSGDQSIVPSWILQEAHTVVSNMPRGIVFLLVNAMTQMACISGVNLLSAKSSAVTVTIVLNIRKLVSFIFSTLLFGHSLSWKMIFGSALVFSSGALYSYETSWRLPRERKRAKAGVEKKVQ